MFMQMVKSLNLVHDIATLIASDIMYCVSSLVTHNTDCTHLLIFSTQHVKKYLRNANSAKLFLQQRKVLYYIKYFLNVNNL